MPFRHAHWYILSLFPLAALAFWPSYLSGFGSASWEFHAHGLTASAWLVLLAAQSWSIHHGQRAAHRTLGPLVLLLFPLFMAGGAGIFLGMAGRHAAGAPFQALWAPSLFWLDVVAVAMSAAFVYLGLKHRREVKVHSAYLLATAIGLIPPILGRLSAIPLGIRGPEDLARMHPGFHAANLIAAAIAFVIAWRAGRAGRPFAVAGILTAASSLLFEWPGRSAAWEAIYSRLAGLPSLPFVLLAGLVGVGVVTAGWIAGRRERHDGGLRLSGA